MTSETMGDPVTQGQFFQAIEQLRADHLEAHKRLRETIETGFEKVGERMEKHEADDRIVANDVLIIKTQRQMEAAQALRRGTWAGILAAAGLTGLLEGMKHLAGWK